MALWIPITVLAALLQCLRTAQQQRLKGVLSTNGAAFVRFAYGFPLALVGWSVLTLTDPAAMPVPGPAFFLYVLIGGVAQILATSLLILAFSLRNFAVGTAYSKTETVQAAIFATLFLGEPLSGGAWIAIAVSLSGVMLLTLQGAKLSPGALLSGLGERAAQIGILAGGLFGVSAVAIRAAALTLDGPALDRSVLTLMAMTGLQTLLMLIYLRWREPGQIAKAGVSWRSSAPVGVMSVVGSFCWFLAMTLEPVAHVRALGQIELVFTFFAARLMLGESPNRGEILGSGLVVGGVVVLLLVR